MFASRVGSWNLRDQHMVETLDALVNHLGGSRPRSQFGLTTLIWETRGPRKWVSTVNGMLESWRGCDMEKTLCS